MARPSFPGAGAPRRRVHLLRGLRLAASAALLGPAAAWPAPISVHDGQRTVRLPGPPKRVVVLEFSFLDALAAVGVTPAGVADDGDPARVLPRVRQAVGAWTSVGLRSQPSIEAIGRLKPDLIVADLARHAAQYPDLSAIAPTLLLPSRGEDHAGSVQTARLIGQALGLADRMEARIAQNQRHLAEVARTVARLVPPATTVLFGVARESSFSVHGPEAYAGSVLQSLGLRVQAVRQNGAPTEFISLEQLLAMNPAWLLVGHYRRPSLVDQWARQPLWKLLKAVRDKHVAEVDGDTWGRNRGLMASEQIADDMVAVLRGGKAAVFP